MIRQGFILTTAMLLSGCGYHFANQIDAYDLMPRPVTNKRFQIVPPDESIQSRMFSGRFADGLAKKGVIISTHQPDYVLRFRMSSSQENMQYSEQLLTGVTGYVVDKKTTRTDKHGESHTDYDYRPVDGVIGTETMSQMHYMRQLDVEVYPSAKGAKQVLKVSMQSNAPVPSDSIAYSAMIDAFTDKFDAPLRSGNYVAVIPWN